MSFGKYKLGELDNVSFGLLNTSLVVSKNGGSFCPQNWTIFGSRMGRKCRPKTPIGISYYSSSNQKLGFFALKIDNFWQ